MCKFFRGKRKTAREIFDKRTSYAILEILQQAKTPLTFTDICIGDLHRDTIIMQLIELTQKKYISHCKTDDSLIFNRKYTITKAGEEALILYRNKKFNILEIIETEVIE